MVIEATITVLKTSNLEYFCQCDTVTSSIKQRKKILAERKMCIALLICENKKI